MKKQVFDRFDFGFINDNTELFKQYGILPELLFIIDKQFNETFESEDEIDIGYNEYTLFFRWINLSLYFSIKIKSGK